MEILEGEENKQYLSEKIMTENFLDLVKGKGTKAQEAQRVPNKLDSKRSTPRHIIIK